jgi:hypothetical protein
MRRKQAMVVDIFKHATMGITQDEDFLPAREPAPGFCQKLARGFKVFIHALSLPLLKLYGVAAWWYPRHAKRLNPPSAVTARN